MPVVLGLASSHAPAMFCPAEKWPQIHKGLVRDVPQPRQLALETPEVLESYVQRVKAGFAALRAQMERVKPDALIIVGDDQDEVFSDALIPTFAMFLGQEAEGSASISWLNETDAENRINLQCQPELSKVALEGLIERGFDVGYVKKLTPLARPARGLGHAFTRTSRATGIHELGIPCILLFMNAYHPPLPNARRCYELGQALREIFANRPERIAIYGSGGLSHDPLGPRAGWIDEKLDRWVVERIERGEGAELQKMFTFDTDTNHGGTGEIRCWITVAGAFDGVKGKVVDYIPAYHAVTGLGFAYWTENEAEAG